MKFFGLRRGNADGGSTLVACVPQSEICVEVPHDGLALVADAVRRAVDVDLSGYRSRFTFDEDLLYFTRWPGEHYYLLHALTQLLAPSLVLDVGTYHGASALAMADHADELITYDIVPLEQMPHGIHDLLASHPHVSQEVGDLADPDFYATQVERITRADLILLDGPKDGVFEYEVVPRLLANMKPGSLLILDDIRFANMQDLWRSIDKPRLDIGSFAHSSGTGVIFC